MRRFFKQKQRFLRILWCEKYSQIFEPTLENGAAQNEIERLNSSLTFNECIDFSISSSFSVGSLHAFLTTGLISPLSLRRAMRRPKVKPQAAVNRLFTIGVL